MSGHTVRIECVCVRGFGREALDMSLIVAELMGLLRERETERPEKELDLVTAFLGSP